MTRHYGGGGQAFPIAGSQNTGSKYADPTFNIPQLGMDLRDYYAAKAMQSLISHPHYNILTGIDEFNLGDRAYEIADDMLDAKEKG